MTLSVDPYYLNTSIFVLASQWVPIKKTSLSTKHVSVFVPKPRCQLTRQGADNECSVGRLASLITKEGSARKEKKEAQGEIRGD